MMDYRYIEQLVERYFDGETTPQEEVILRTFFSQDDIPAALMPMRGMFMAEAAWAAQRPSDGIVDAILERVEQPACRARRITLAWRLRPLYKAAAAVAIVLSLGLAAGQGLTTRDATVTPSATRQIGDPMSVLAPDAQQITPMDSIVAGQ